MGGYYIPKCGWLVFPYFTRLPLSSLFGAGMVLMLSGGSLQWSAE